MNDIYHRKYTLDFDLWEPQTKAVDAEFDKLMFDLKNKVLLAHAGNVKIVPVSEERFIKQDVI